jgi:hypothetical protein
MRFVRIVLLTIGVFVVVNLASRVYDTYRVVQAELQVNKELIAAQAETAILEALKLIVQTDAWIEKYVRTCWHWTRANETLVMPRDGPPPNCDIVAAITAARDTKAFQTEPAPRAFWQEWLDRIFDALFGPAQ